MKRFGVIMLIVVACLAAHIPAYAEGDVAKTRAAEIRSVWQRILDKDGALIDNMAAIHALFPTGDADFDLSVAQAFIAERQLNEQVMCMLLLSELGALDTADKSLRSDCQSQVGDPPNDNVGVSWKWIFGYMSELDLEQEVYNSRLDAMFDWMAGGSPVTALQHAEKRGRISALLNDSMLTKERVGYCQDQRVNIDPDGITRADAALIAFLRDEGLMSERLETCLKSFEPTGHLFFCYWEPTALKELWSKGKSFKPKDPQAGYFIILRAKDMTKKSDDQVAAKAEKDGRSACWPLIERMTNPVYGGEPFFMARDPNQASIAIEYLPKYEVSGTYKNKRTGGKSTVYNASLQLVAKNIKTGKKIAELSLRHDAPDEFTTSSDQSTYYMDFHNLLSKENEPKLKAFLEKLEATIK